MYGIDCILYVIINRIKYRIYCFCTIYYSNIILIFHHIKVAGQPMKKAFITLLWLRRDLRPEVGTRLNF